MKRLERPILIDEKINGFFHKWGISKEKINDTTSVSVTKGIVELENGQIDEVYPKQIRFLPN